MRKLLVFQHAPSEPLGVLDPMLRRWGFRIRYANFARHPGLQLDIGRYNGLVVLGGPMNVDQADAYPHLQTEIACIREALRLEVPVLGICLGAQLLAAALGARVRPNRVREIGWYPLHAYTFDLPPGAVHLASSESCEHQAFRFGERAYGLQFHLEADEALIQRWLNVPAYRAELEAETDIEQILQDTHGHVGPALKLSERMFHEFIELFEWRRPAVRFASR